MNNKAIAVSVFIILGIIALLSIGAVVFIQSSVTEITEEIEAETVPLQIEPVQTYIEDCIEQLTVEAVENSAKHGGYVNDVGVVGIQYPTRSANAVRVDPQDLSSEVAYWSIISCDGEPSQGNACDFSNNIPEFSNVEEQIANHIDSNLIACLGTFSDFAIIYDIPPISTPESKVMFSDEQVSVQTNMKVILESKSTGEQYTMNRFGIQKPTKFKQMYDTALELTQEQNSQRRVEYNILEWIDGYSGLNKARNALPPKAKFDVVNDPVIWSYDEAKGYFTNMYMSYLIPQFKVRGSKNFVETDDILISSYDVQDAEKKTYDYSVFNEQSISVENFEYYFKYMPDWPMFFMINDRQSGYFAPETTDMMEVVPGLDFQTNDYNNLYSIETPMIVQIIDNDVDSDFGDTLTFNLAWQIKIANNNPVNTTNDIDGEFSFSDEGASLACQIDQWNNKSSIKFVDAYDKPVANISAYFDLGKRCYVTADENGVVHAIPNGIYYLERFNVDDYVLKEPVYMSINPDDVISLSVPLVEKHRPSVQYYKQYVTKEIFYYCYENVRPQDLDIYAPQYSLSQYNQINANLTGNQCIYILQEKDSTMTRKVSIPAGSRNYWKLSNPIKLSPNECRSATVTGNLENNDDELVNTFSVYCDPDTQRPYTTGFIPGTYNLSLVYFDDDNANIITNTMLVIGDTRYRTMNNYVMQVNFPIVDMDGLSIDDLDLVIGNDFMYHVTHQELNIPEGTFYAFNNPEYNAINFELK